MYDLNKTQVRDLGPLGPLVYFNKQCKKTHLWVFHIHLRNLPTHTLLFWHVLENLNFEFKIIMEYIRTMFSGDTRLFSNKKTKNF